MGQGANRIGILPDSPDLKEDLEHALEFLMAVYTMRGIGSIREAFESGFSV